MATEEKVSVRVNDAGNVVISKKVNGHSTFYELKKSGDDPVLEEVDPLVPNKLNGTAITGDLSTSEGDIADDGGPVEHALVNQRIQEVYKANHRKDLDVDKFIEAAKDSGLLNHKLNSIETSQAVNRVNTSIVDALNKETDKEEKRDKRGETVGTLIKVAVSGLIAVGSIVGLGKGTTQGNAQGLAVAGVSLFGALIGGSVFLRSLGKVSSNPANDLMDGIENLAGKAMNLVTGNDHSKAQAETIENLTDPAHAK